MWRTRSFPHSNTCPVSPHLYWKTQKFVDYFTKFCRSQVLCLYMACSCNSLVFVVIFDDVGGVLRFRSTVCRAFIVCASCAHLTSQTRTSSPIPSCFCDASRFWRHSTFATRCRLMETLPLSTLTLKVSSARTSVCQSFVNSEFYHTFVNMWFIVDVNHVQIVRFACRSLDFQTD